MVSFVVVAVESFFANCEAALIARGYSLSIAAVARCSSMWSMDGMTVAILGVSWEENNGASLKI